MQKDKQNSKTGSQSSGAGIEMHPNDKTGMSTHAIEAKEDKHSRSDNTTDKSRGSRTVKPEGDETVFPSSKDKEKGVMDKTKIEELPNEKT